MTTSFSKSEKNETYIFDFARFVCHWRQCSHGKNLLNVTILDLPNLIQKPSKDETDRLLRTARKVFPKLAHS